MDDWENVKAGCRNAAAEEYRLQFGELLDTVSGRSVVVMDGVTRDEDGTWRAYIATGPTLETRYAVTIKRIHA